MHRSPTHSNSVVFACQKGLVHFLAKQNSVSPPGYMRRLPLREGVSVSSEKGAQLRRRRRCRLALRSVSVRTRSLVVGRIRRELRGHGGERPALFYNRNERNKGQKPRVSSQGHRYQEQVHRY